MIPAWTRRQATLFLRADHMVEGVRTRFNPKQAEIINAHVTLCREDEVSDWSILSDKLRGSMRNSIKLDFGRPVRNGDLVLLPCVGSTSEFDALREFLLDSGTRKQKPHITLIHPRNGFCTDDIFEEIYYIIEPFSHIFSAISLIGQISGGAWKIIDSHALAVGK